MHSWKLEWQYKVVKCMWVYMYITEFFSLRVESTQLINLHVIMIDTHCLDYHRLCVPHDETNIILDHVFLPGLNP